MWKFATYNYKVSPCLKKTNLRKNAKLLVLSYFKTAFFKLSENILLSSFQVADSKYEIKVILSSTESEVLQI